MANFIFDAAKHKLLDRDVSGTMNLEAAGYRVILLTTTKLTAATHGNTANMQTLVDSSGVTEVADGVSGYDQEGAALANAAWVASSTTGSSSFTYLKADNITWSGFGTLGEADIVGAVLYIDTNNNNDSANDFSSVDFPVAYFDFDATPDGSDLTLQWGSCAGAATTGSQGVVIKIS